MSLLLAGFLAASQGIPEPAPLEPRPLAPAEHPWSERSGALVEAGGAALFAVSSPLALGMGSLRAGMHDYGLEWTVGGAVGRALSPVEGFAYELLVAPGGRVPLGGRGSMPVRATAGLVSVPESEGEGGTSFALGLEAGIDLALDRMWRIEAVLAVRAATGLEDDGSTPLLGIFVGLVAVP